MTTMNPVEMMTDTFKTMTDSLTGAMKTTLKFNEDTARFWTDAFTKNAEELRTQTQKVVDEVAPFNKTNVERFQKNFEDQMSRTMNFMRDTLKTTPVVNGDTTERMMTMWRDSFDTMRSSFDSVVKANQEMFKTWTDVCAAPINGKAQKTAKTAN